MNKETENCLLFPIYAPGLSLNFSGEIPEQLGLVTDGDGLSAITRLEGENDLEGLKKIEFSDYISSALGFHLIGNKSIKSSFFQKKLFIGPKSRDVTLIAMLFPSYFNYINIISYSKIFNLIYSTLI